MCVCACVCVCVCAMSGEAVVAVTFKHQLDTARGAELVGGGVGEGHRKSAAPTAAVVTLDRAFKSGSPF